MAERVFRVKWYHTEEFERDIGLDEAEMQDIADRAASAQAEALRIAEAIGRPRSYDPEEEADLIEDLIQERLMEVIVDMDQKALTACFQANTAREITEMEELDA